uniref:Secreted protein n=1 Tax=Helianthus annuus TaxID=4232 RepID=A0A251U0W4_HELAN
MILILYILLYISNHNMGLRQGIFCLLHIDHQPFPFYLLPLLPLEFSQAYNWHHYHQGNAHNKQTPLSLSCLDRRPEIGAPANRRWLWLTATVVPRNSGSRDVYVR